MSVDGYEPTPRANPVLPPTRVCPHCGKPLPEVALPANACGALVSKAPARMAETERIARHKGTRVEAPTQVPRGTTDT